MYMIMIFMTRFQEAKQRAEGAASASASVLEADGGAGEKK